jgi:glyoxylase-like metal-dependent hydrolase (beta-lactamase superfamily II)
MTMRSVDRSENALADEALARAAGAGVHAIVLATPFGVGPVNTYLVEDEPLTLVDCGPNSATNLVELERRLAEHGYRLRDIGLVVVTHQHMDHCGLAGAIAARSDAEIACLDLMVPVLEDWEAFQAQDDADAHTMMLRHGVDAHVADALRSVATVLRGYGAPAPVHRRLEGGTRLQLRDRGFDLYHRPGHSPSDLMLVDPGSRIALSGDHLLSHVSSNALITRPLGQWDGQRPRPLLEYRASLRATRELASFDVAFGGHYGPVLDARTLIDERLAEQDRRAERFLSMLDEGPRSAHELATARWGGRVAITQAFLTLSEVLGHLDLLIADGVVVEDRTVEPVRFERVRG